MRKPSNLGKAARLELYRVALTNAKANTKIVELFNKSGISNEVLDQGTSLLDIARQKHAAAELARKKRAEAYNVFSQKKALIEEKFKEARRKSDIIFLNNQDARKQLELNIRYESSYVKLIAMVKRFYAVLIENPEIADKLVTVGISADDVQAMHTHINEIEELRANYINENGNAQNATDAKTVAMGNLSSWMGKFFALSRNTFKQHPQLMESFSIVVKS